MATGDSSRAKDRIQSIGIVRFPAAKFCLPQFQDHVRVTLGRKEEGSWSRLGRVGAGSYVLPVPVGVAVWV